MFSNRTLSYQLLAIAFLVLPSCCAIAQQYQNPFASIKWQEGPCTSQLGSIAKVYVPAGYLFAEAEGTQLFLELNENPTSGAEIGLIVPDVKGNNEVYWFIVFTYSDIGYVKDDEKDDLDADAILASIIEGTEEANKIRRAKGWIPLNVVGWQTPPYYDEITHNLSWALLGEAEGEQWINFSTRLLGRGGTMDVDLVLDPFQTDIVMPAFQYIMESFSFLKGNRYSEFAEGDKIAKYGLAALVVGGVGAAAVKTGLLAKIWKPIAGVFIALLAFFRRLWRKISGNA